MNTFCTVSFSSCTGVGCRQCENGWLPLGRSCFYLSRYRLSWEESQKNCTARGGSLAVITNQGLQVALISLKFWYDSLPPITIMQFIKTKMIFTLYFCYFINAALSSRTFLPKRENCNTGSGWDDKDQHGTGSTTTRCKRGDSPSDILPIN